MSRNRSARLTRRRRRATATLIVVSAGCVLGATTIVQAVEQHTAEQVAESMQMVDPTAVGADPSQQAAAAPQVEENSTGFTVHDSSVNVTLPKRADDPIALETSSGDLLIEARGVSPAAATGEAVNDGAAVVYAKTGEDSDTSIVPTEHGAETFTQIRSENAGESYSMKVDLPGDEEVRQVDASTVAVIDPTPNDKPADEKLPSPVRPGTAFGRDGAREQRPRHAGRQPRGGAETGVRD